MSDYVHRHAEEKFKLLSEVMRVVSVHGPRQCGKTTMMRRELEGKATFQSLDNEDHLDQAIEQPADFFIDGLRQYGRIAIDEVQKAPCLLGEIKYVVDRVNQPGQFYLSSSCNYRALPTSNESLAGRLGEVRLRTFTRAELEGKGKSFLTQVLENQFGQDLSISDCSLALILGRSVVGGYPAVQPLSSNKRAIWFKNHIKNIIIQDLKAVGNFRKVSSFEKVCKIVARFSSNPLNMAKIAHALKEDQRLVSTYTQALKNLYLVDEIPAWPEKIYSRMKKSSKWVFTDTGLMCAFLKHHDAEDFMVWAEDAKKQGSDLVGNLIETFVYTQIVPLVEEDDEWKIYHLRSADDQEVDFLLENERGEIIAIEVKASEKASSSDFKNMKWLMERLPERKIHGVVLYCGQRVRSYGPNMTAVPIAKMWLP